jgi:hypothetical protein
MRRTLPVFALFLLIFASDDIAIVMGKGFEVGGTVCDVAGHPLEGVAVTAREKESVLFGAADPALTDSAGRFSLLVAKGDWELTFSKEGYVPETVPVSKVTEAMDDVDVTLERAVAIRGRVVRLDGSGVEGVHFYEYLFVGAETATDGSFSLPARAGQHEFEYHARGGAFGSLSVTAPADGVRIVLDQAGHVRGRVVDAAGVPVTSFSVELSLPPQHYTETQHFTDAGGRFLWKDAPADRVTVRVRADGFVAASNGDVEVEAGRATSEITFALRRARTLHGRVVSTTGQPLAGVHVVDPDWATLGETAADGTYEIGGVGSRPTSFEYEKSGFVTVVREVPAGHDDVRIDVQLRPALVLTGRVLAPDGQPLAGAYVTATSAAGSTAPLSARTNAQGGFRLEGLAPGHYDVTAGTLAEPDQPRRKPWLRGSLPDVDVEQVHDVTIRTQPPISAVIYGNISGIDPKLNKVKIYAMSSGHWSDADNDETPASYRMIDAPVGTVTVSAESGSLKTDPVVVEVEPNSEVRVDLQFPETFTIRGHVRRNGSPLSVAEIEIRDESGLPATVFTESDGTYETELGAGQYRISVGNFSVEHAVRRPETFDIDVDLVPIEVSVVDALTGAPIEGAEVRGYGVGVRGGQSDRNGRFTLDAPRGLEAIEVDKDDYGTAIVAAKPALLVKLTRSEETVVHIVDARDGHALSGWAMARDAEGHLIWPTREPKSSMSFFRLPPGRYRISASADGYGSKTIVAEMPSSDIRIALPRGSKLLLQSRRNARGTARLIEPDGGAYVPCWGNAIAEFRIVGRTTWIAPVAPGSYTLEIREPGTKPRTIAVSVGEGETATVSIDP